MIIVLVSTALWDKAFQRFTLLLREEISPCLYFKWVAPQSEAVPLSSRFLPSEEMVSHHLSSQTPSGASTITPPRIMIIKQCNSNLLN